MLRAALQGRRRCSDSYFSTPPPCLSASPWLRLQYWRERVLHCHDMGKYSVS